MGKNFDIQNFIRMQNKQLTNKQLTRKKTALEQRSDRVDWSINRFDYHQWINEWLQFKDKQKENISRLSQKAIQVENKSQMELNIDKKLFHFCQVGQFHKKTKHVYLSRVNVKTKIEILPKNTKATKWWKQITCGNQRNVRQRDWNDKRRSLISEKMIIGSWNWRQVWLLYADRI